jgi:hypothetical protein
VRYEEGPFSCFQILGEGKKDNRVGTFVTIKGVKAFVAITTYLEGDLPHPDMLWQ